MNHLTKRLLAGLLIATSCCRPSAIGDQPQEQLQFSKWSGSVNVPDPVAISFDNSGKAYVTQTQRRKSQDLDIRQHQEWIPQDVQLSSVEGKRAFLRSVLAIGQDEANAKHVEDRNKDGHHDYRDLMVISERIHVLQDKDGDGTADSIQLFAEDFRSEVTGIAAGVLHFDGTVYATIAPDVWRLQDSNDDGIADHRSILATGFGLHIAYAGHDMHGLTVGPDGKIYWSVGDKGINATSQEGRHFHFPNQGGVMRCNPDGSDFEVFAHGLRNVQELAFDQYGNLFGVDNDADKPTEQERFVYIVKDMDAGWRCNYQYRGNDYDPWMAENLWQPWQEGQPSYILPPIRNYVDGPAGFAFNPGTALSPEYKDYFFLTEAPKGRQYAFQVEPNGASFKMVNEHSIGEGVAMVGINFGPDGGLYGVDWGGGYPLNKSGAVWKIDNPKFADSPERREVKQLLNTSFADRDSVDLQKLIAHPDQRIRLQSQFELANRNDVAAFKVALTADSNVVAKCHAIWGLGQIARKKLGSKGHNTAQESATSVLRDMLRNADSEVVAQTLRTIGDLRTFDSSLITPILRHKNPRVRFMAASTLGQHGSNQAVSDLIEFADSLKMSDTYLRFSLIKALAKCASPTQLAAFSNHSNKILQLAAVVALRRLASPLVAEFLNSKDTDVSCEAARAIHDDFSIPNALPELAYALNRLPSHNEAFVRRAINANFRLGNAAQLATLAADSSANVDLRLEAMDCLQNWFHPSSLDRVTGRHRDFPASTRDFDLSELTALISKVAEDPNTEIRSAALLAAAELQVPLLSDSLVAIVTSTDSKPNTQIAALKKLQSQNYTALADVAEIAMKSSNPLVRMTAVSMLNNLQTDRSLSRIDAVLKTSEDTEERQHAILLLGSLDNSSADELLLTFVSQMKDELQPELWLEICEAAERRGKTNVNVKDALRNARASINDNPSDPASEFSDCLTGGNETRGNDLFMTHLSAQCIRCHRIGKTGSNVGPNLQDVGIKRDANYILRSIVAPSADIDKNYRTQIVVLASGKTLQGLPLKQNDSTITLADSQGKTTVVQREEIDDIIEQQISIMPEIRKTLRRREIRDLVAFLLSQQTKK